MSLRKIRTAARVAAGLAVMLVSLSAAVACGPFFPNNLLDAGDNAVLQPPLAGFTGELARLSIPAGGPRAVPLPPGQTFQEQADNAELADLTAALRSENMPPEEAQAVIAFHLSQRAKLAAYFSAVDTWMAARTWQTDTNGENGHWEPTTNPPPVFPNLAIAPGLPTEFALYFKGVIAWRRGDGDAAEKYWQRLLDLPPAQRHFKSTWAAFMCGKVEMERDQDYIKVRAAEQFEDVRAMAARGFADPIGLAVAAVGLEGQVELRLGHYARAIDCYLKQYAADDDSAGESLRTTAREAITGTNNTPEEWHALATNSLARRVINAYLLTCGWRHLFPEPGMEPDAGNPTVTNNVSVWLAAVEAAGVHDEDSAAQLALAAYQQNDLVAAQRWVKLAPRDATAQWVQAKLDLRAGRVDDAVKLLTQLCRKFPVAPVTNRAPTTLGDNLSVSVGDEEQVDITGGQQVFGELGVLHLARREYAEALDALLRSGYWTDAAYVGERVLTPDELKTYVDRHWPDQSRHKQSPEELSYRGFFGGNNPGLNIRYLLARRLARLGRLSEAGAYFPRVFQPVFSEYAAARRQGANTNLAAVARATALFHAAGIARTNGMELFATELEPDWSEYAGGFELNRMSEQRLTNSAHATLNRASPDELARVATSPAIPDERYHYRYQAAELAWQAAALLPDDTDQTAQILWTAGTWIKYRDPQKADRFYKALVRRCPHTKLGATADQMRWFPNEDLQGNIQFRPSLAVQRLGDLLNQELTDQVTNNVATNETDQVVYSVDYPVPGRPYLLQLGDTLAALAAGAARMEPALRKEDIVAANPGKKLVPLEPGQIIMIPARRADAVPAGSAR